MLQSKGSVFGSIALPALTDGPLAWLRPMMDEIDYGIILWADNRAAHVNRTAQQRLLEPACPLRVSNGQACADNPADDFELRAALRDAVKSRRRRLMTLRGECKNLPIAVVPFGPDADNGSNLDGAAMIVFGKRALCPQLTAHWFCTMHQLTPTESAVLAELLAGHEPRAIAQRSGVSISTVRTQIASISDKTSLRGIRELIMAAAALPPLVTIVPSLPGLQMAGVGRPLSETRPVAA